MRPFRFLLVLWVVTLSVAALAIVVMDKDESSANDPALTTDEYFARMSEIDNKTDRLFEDEVFGEKQETAKSYGTAFDGVLAAMAADYEALSPPSAAKNAHSDLVDAVHAYRSALAEALAPMTIDAPPEDFDALFEAKLADEDEAVSISFCAIEKIGRQNKITADVGCEQR
jgi:hypothetical protein